MSNFTIGDFEIFKGNVCHMLKNEGWAFFIKKILTEDLIQIYWNKDEKAKAFYLLAMVDYLSKEHDIPLYNKYNEFRRYRLAEPIYPMSMIIESKQRNIDIKELYKDSAINEFLKYNIVEGNIYDII